jgi:hypothetical protein
VSRTPKDFRWYSDVGQQVITYQNCGAYGGLSIGSVCWYFPSIVRTKADTNSGYDDFNPHATFKFHSH